MPLVKGASLPCSHAWITFGQPTPPYTPGSKCCRRGQPGTGSCPRSLLERKTSSRQGACRLHMARQFTKDESALPTPRLSARCGNAERSCWVRRIVLPSPIPRPPQRATHGIWITLRVAARAGRQPRSRRGWCRSLSEPRPWGRCYGQLPIVGLPDSRPAMVFSPWRVCSLSPRA